MRVRIARRTVELFDSRHSSWRSASRLLIEIASVWYIPSWGMYRQIVEAIGGDPTIKGYMLIDDEDYSHIVVPREEIFEVDLPKEIIREIPSRTWMGAPPISSIEEPIRVSV